jgi:ankyrin repeat protein
MLKAITLRGERHCNVCSTTKNVDLLFLTCESCGESFAQICRRCAARPCPKCKGRLDQPDNIFPRSLFKAISDGDELKVDMLLQGRKVDLNKLTPDGEPPLFLAARGHGKSTLPIFEKLVSFGASPHAKNAYGRTALIEAVRTRGARARNREVLSRLSGSVDAQDNAGMTALMFAVQGAGMFGNPRGNIQLAQDLLAMGADPLIQDGKRRTALGHALGDNKEGKNQDTVDFLKKRMLTAVALREFSRQNTHGFDEAGNLKFEPKKVQKKRARADR